MNDHSFRLAAIEVKLNDGLYIVACFFGRLPDFFLRTLTPDVKIFLLFPFVAGIKMKLPTGSGPKIYIKKG